MRAVRAAGDEVLSVGRTRRTSYAARRRLRGSSVPLALFRVDEAGRPSEVGRMHLAYPDGCLLEGEALRAWPLGADMRDGWFDGIPYPLQDMRPEGYMGRAFAREHAAVLQVPEDPTKWNDDDALHALSLMGADSIGCFIIGQAAYRLWLDRRRAAPVVAHTGEQVEDAYAQSAERSLRQGIAGSSAGGEFPKFPAVRELDGRKAHVLVKFSGSDDTPGTRRWSDLLVCEHLALEIAPRLPGLAAARTRVYQTHGRTFMEAERFDRHGAIGRSPMCSWAAVNNAWFGLRGRPWTEGASRMLEQGLINADTRDAIARQWHYGQLIGNTDMHDGNLSFVPSGEALRLTPMYDMLPMLYAPHRGVELPPRNFTPRPPLPSEQFVWLDGGAAAVEFWQRASGDRRISAEFREICARNAGAVRDCMRIFTG
jgi:hypothetical protein